MAVRNPFKKKAVWVDPLELAERAANEALAVFQKAKTDLINANGHLTSVKEAAAAAIQAAQDRLNEADTKQARNLATITKLSELTG